MPLSPADACSPNRRLYHEHEYASYFREQETSRVYRRRRNSIRASAQESANLLAGWCARSFDRAPRRKHLSSPNSDTLAAAPIAPSVKFERFGYLSLPQLSQVVVCQGFNLTGIADALFATLPAGRSRSRPTITGFGAGGSGLLGSGLDRRISLPTVEAVRNPRDRDTCRGTVERYRWYRRPRARQSERRGCVGTQGTATPK